MQKYELTSFSKKILNDAKEEAAMAGQREVDLMFLSIAIVTQVASSLHIQILIENGVDISDTEFKIRQATEEIYLKKSKDQLMPTLTPHVSEVKIGNQVREVIKSAGEMSVADDMGDISPEYLVCAWLKSPVSSFLDEILAWFSLTSAELSLIIRSEVKNIFDREEGGREELETKETEHTEIPMDNIWPESETTSGSLLSTYGTNLTKKAEAGEIDEVYNRDDQILSMIETILRKKKSNPMILGDAGVGKTAIVEGLALALVKNDGKFSDLLVNHEIISLDLAKIVAGTKYRGEFEERMSMIIEEVVAHTKGETADKKQVEKKNIILFIDEIHMLVSSGASEGGMDGANILKPALSTGDVKCIGATTFKEYKKSFEKDPALERRFQLIKLQEPTAKETLDIVSKLKADYEGFHNVKYSDEVIKAIVHLSDQYIFDKNFPDKAIDILDQVGSTVKNKKFNKPKVVRDSMSKAINIQEKIELIEDEDEFEEAYLEIEKLKIKASDSYKRYVNRFFNNLIEVKVSDVVDVISRKSGVPKEKVSSSSFQKVNNLERDLSKFVFGQEEAIRITTENIQVSYLGLSDDNKPLASFLFAGTSGVGKTYLAKQIASFIFGSEEKMIRFDMSEFADSTSGKKLIGADAGYVGYEEGGLLVEQIKKQPYSVVLFDEIEKCHDSVKNILLQVLDDGRLTDNTGKTVSFKNTIIIMTTNAGSAQQTEQSLGFVGDSASEQDENRKKAIRKSFAPEFISRVSNIVYFKPLDEKNLKKIATQELNILKKKVKENHGINLTFSKDLLLSITKKDKVQVGARAVINNINQRVKPFIAKEILRIKSEEAEAVSINVGVDGDEVIIKRNDKIKKK